MNISAQEMKAKLVERKVISQKNAHLKFTESELLALSEQYMKSLENRLDKAKEVYLRQKEELEQLRQPSLWKLEIPQSIPPNLRREYLRRLKAGEIRPIDENGKIIVKKGGEKLW